MQKFTVSQLAQGSGIAAKIERGKSLIITKEGEPVALLRPFSPGDRGEEVIATMFYKNPYGFVEVAEKGKTVIVLRHGEPFATLCKYEAKPKAKASKSRPKRQAKARAKRTPPPPPAKSKTEVPAKVAELMDSIKQTMRRDELVEGENAGLHEACELMFAAKAIPRAQRLELLKLGASLADQGELTLGIRLLQGLKEVRGPSEG